LFYLFYLFYLFFSLYLFTLLLGLNLYLVYKEIELIFTIKNIVFKKNLRYLRVFIASSIIIIPSSVPSTRIYKILPFLC